MNLRRKIGEMLFNWGAGLRTVFSGDVWRFGWPSIAAGRANVNMAKARTMYRNDDDGINLGAGFCRAIIDNTVSFMGLPRATSDDEVVNELCNKSIHTFWQGQIQEMIRNSCRDSRTIVRIRRPDAKNVLVTDVESAGCKIEVLQPERVEIVYNEQDKDWIDEAIIEHEVMVEKVPAQQDQGSFTRPQFEKHDVLEIITVDRFRYWDETESKWRDDLEQPNTWGFVPLLEVFNEWDDYLKTGQSDLEAPYAFIAAFHEVLGQALQAHKYHSIPKAKFKLNDVEGFLANNFVDSFEKDENNRVIPGTFKGTVSWQGKEIIFLKAPDEDVDFLEARSVLGDSKTLLEFLLDCICISSETPEWAFMRVEGATQGAATAQTLPFQRKIERKRKMFAEPVQKLLKMLLVINQREPVIVPLDWDDVDPQTAAAQAQAMQQETMAVDLMHQKQLISDRSAVSRLKKYFPEISSVDQELEDAKNNRVFTATDPNANGNVRAVVQGGQGANE